MAFSMTTAKEVGKASEASTTKSAVALPIAGVEVILDHTSMWFCPSG
jgi:hypothetical protein